MYDKSHKMTVGEIAGASNPKKKSTKKKTAAIRRPVKKDTKPDVSREKKSGY